MIHGGMDEQISCDDMEGAGYPLGGFSDFSALRVVHRGYHLPDDWCSRHLYGRTGAWNFPAGFKRTASVSHEKAGQGSVCRL